ncbi:MAG: NAD(P)-dependent oxidoreductase, partial [Eggerthella lenta]|nr:NAD(P)-dependent oxidoreductase [Eggerthella lenta]
ISAVEADALYRAVRRSSASLDQATERVGAATPVAEQVLAAVNTGRFDGMYTVEMFMAELSAALTAADDVDLILPQAEACLHLLELLAVIGGSDKAPAALALVYGEEKTCAEQGLDWTRAEQAYGDVAEGFDDLDDDGHDHGHDHGSFGDYPGYGAYSAN